ncbi:MAG: IS30 family transposase [bacterium]|nr:IS30 family transposase [bacterium]
MTKKLSYSERVIIERMLNKDMTFSTIANVLERSASTISREILRYRCFTSKATISSDNDCTHYVSCQRNRLCLSPDSHDCYGYRCKKCPEGFDCRTLCKYYESRHCDMLDKPPYVCSGCPSEKQKQCRKDHAYYTAHRADSAHKKALKESHSGIRKTPDELIEIGAIITPLIKKGQSINHIVSTHSEQLGVSEKTLYNYIEQGVFSVRNIDLPKKVVYKPRRKPKVLTKFDYKCRQGRSYEDFLNFCETNPDVPIVEMDTVKGKLTKGKVFLIFIFRNQSFMLIFLMPDSTQKSVLSVFDSLTKLLGIDTFRKLFPVILTDNGTEFKDPISLENSENGVPRTTIFYCDPQASWQKPFVETNHRLIRRIIPKGHSLDSLSLSDTNLIVCHINSLVRESLDGCTPFDLMTSSHQKKLLSVLDLHPIPPDEVNLTPNLIKH